MDIGKIILIASGGLLILWGIIFIFWEMILRYRVLRSGGTWSKESQTEFQEGIGAALKLEFRSRNIGVTLVIIGALLEIVAFIFG